MIHEGPRVIEDPDNYDAKANIMWAGMMAHNNSCGVGRSQDWNSHNIEHELSALYDCAHGAGLAVTMPAVFRYVMGHNVMRFAQAAVRVWGCRRILPNWGQKKKIYRSLWTPFATATGEREASADL